MPKIPIDYSKNVIYKLVCNDLNVKDIYVGHTTNFIDRKRSHKHNCHNENSSKYYHLKVYEVIRANMGWDNWSMILVEEYPCENRLQAEQRERYWLETLGATLNYNVPSRNKKEYYQQNKEYLKEKNKEYYQQNAEEIIKKKKEYQKEYRQQNAEKIIKKKKEYWQKNADKMNQRRRFNYALKKETEKKIDEIEI